MFSFDKASSEQTFSKEHFKIAFLEKEFDRFSFKRPIMYTSMAIFAYSLIIINYEYISLSGGTFPWFIQ